MRRHDRLRQGRTPPRGNTGSISKICRIFPDRRYCHDPGGWFGFDLRTSCDVLGSECEEGERCRAAARLVSARCRGRPVRASGLRNTQYESISSVSSRRDPGAPRLQNPHPPLRFRFAQPRSTQYFVLGTEKEGSLRSHAARRLRRLAPSTRYEVPSTECLDSHSLVDFSRERSSLIICSLTRALDARASARLFSRVFITTLLRRIP